MDMQGYILLIRFLSALLGMSIFSHSYHFIDVFQRRSRELVKIGTLNFNI